MVSDPDHVKEWWPEEARYEAEVGSVGEIAFVRDDGRKVETLTVVEVQRPDRFSFRWTHPAGEAAAGATRCSSPSSSSRVARGRCCASARPGSASGGGRPRSSEATYLDHVQGWDHFLPRLVAYADTVAARS